MRRRRGSLAALALLAALHAGCGGPGVTSPGEPLTVPPPRPPDTGCGSTRYVTGDGALDALQDQFRPVLERNRREFVGRTGSVRGFGAGTSYPQVWLRDSATLIPATRYFYPREYLTTWLEEHLAHQRPGGELWDWIAAAEPGQLVANAPRASQIFGAGGVVLSADKNTTVTDQETSAVDAAWSVFAFTGDHNWLRQSVAGRPLVDRLDAALRFVLESRFDPATGLVTNSYVYEPGQRRARLQIRSNAPGAGRLSLRIPGEADVAALAVDGAPVAFEIDEVGNDRYARLTTTWSSRSIELLLR